MELLATFGRTLGFSFGAGINLYATVAVLGLASRYEWVTLPPQFQVFDNDFVIGAALVMYVIEFFADKIPFVDTIWDAIHTVIRPVGGAVIAVTALGEASPTMEGLIALLGGTVAAGTHFGKAGTRAAVNTSPEPFSNWILSLGEDVFVVGLALLALQYPVAAAVVVLLLLALMVFFAAWIVRAVRRRFSRAPDARVSRPS
jgi:nicotinamide riboside transporter PnuC